MKFPAQMSPGKSAAAEDMLRRHSYHCLPQKTQGNTETHFYPFKQSSFDLSDMEAD